MENNYWHDYYENNLIGEEKEAIDEAYNAVTSKIEEHDLKTSNDDRAEELIAALTQYVVESREYYFAGGLYKEGDDYYFDAVRPSNGLPYITKINTGLKLAEHHSSLYQLTTTLWGAKLVDYREGGAAASPTFASLSDELHDEIVRSIESNEFYN